MKTVAIVSLKGGVGKTTTAANLGAALAAHVGSVLLVDCDPRNQLGIHFGLACDAPGLVQACRRNVSWSRAAREVAEGITCLPFGAPTHDELRDFEALLAREPELLRGGLADPAFEPHSLAIVDVAPWPSEIFERVLPLAHLVVIVLQPDPASFATLPSVYELLQRHPHVAAHVLVNGVDGMRLGQDVLAVLSAQPQVSVLPFVIHRDAAVPEALGGQRPVIDSAPSSQSAADFRQAAEWVLDTLEAQPSQSEPRAVREDEPDASLATRAGR